ncbi:Gfo/Idh/MocA family protein [Rhabdothermincola salaria]|uniref:Gfo/Idh/MocA family protein n=1 Tax=Rhabdothermincola salaria TaxID=2903142 RepID=UPI001E2D8BB0|nr:Gfo/Idh/MocA family oxidoreductase [Rhabdothermincola salaria]MCD9622401.1 Gfo/Idh/MocA family oxidoreductase [Rhabdothermincola salaria]
MARRRPTLALAGAGMISVVHAMSASLAGFDIVAVASRSEERARERADQVGARACRYQDLPAGADAVVVATPPSCHVDDAIAAMEAGAGVLVEKPLATTLADADRVVEVAERTGRPFVYAENLVFAPVVQQAAALARTLGPLHHLSVRALQPRPDWGGFLDPSWGGGVLFDLGVHPLAVALLIAGEDPAVAVNARLERGEGIDVDDHAVVEVHLASSLPITVEASWRHPTTVWDLQAAADTGVVRAELQPGLLLEHNGDPVPTAATAEGADPRLEGLGYVAQLGVLSEALRGGPSVFGARFGRQVLDIVMAAHQSANQGGATVALPFAGPRDQTPWQLWTAS